MLQNGDALTDDQWERLKVLVPGERKGTRGRRADNRRFLDALLWMARSGGRWKDLPDSPSISLKGIVDGWRRGVIQASR